MTHHVRVGVLRGGPSNEYEISLQSGASVLEALRQHHEATHRAHDIFIDRSGTWHIDGMAVEPERALKRIDVVFNALHGAYGEDGKIQAFLEAHGMPFTGSGSLASAVGMNKVLAKKALIAHGIKTPAWKEYDSSAIRERADELARQLFHSLLLPAIVKPVSSGSSVGVTLVRHYDSLADALRAAAEHGDAVMIEEYIPGIEATCGVIEGFRGHELYTLPPIEIRPHAGHDTFSYEAKYAGKSEEIIPASFRPEVKRELERLAAEIHRALGLRHYSRSDFIVHPRRGIYALEANTLPGLTSESLIPKALRAVGSGMHELAQHLLALAHKRT